MPLIWIIFLWCSSLVSSFQTSNVRTIQTPRSNSPLSAGSSIDDNKSKNPLYQLLATPGEASRPGSDFFYNDEVISHLHGYMFLVGGLAAHDEVFLFLFIFLAFAAATSTLAGLVPANPRVPAAVASVTFIGTCLGRYVFGFEPMLFSGTEGLGLGYDGPAESALPWEIVVCALNVGWGAFGPWKAPSKSMPN